MKLGAVRSKPSIYSSTALLVAFLIVTAVSIVLYSHFVVTAMRCTDSYKTYVR